MTNVYKTHRLYIYHIETIILNLNCYHCGIQSYTNWYSKSGVRHISCVACFPSEISSISFTWSFVNLILHIERLCVNVWSIIYSTHTMHNQESPFHGFTIIFASILLNRFISPTLMFYTIYSFCRFTILSLSMYPYQMHY